MLEITPNCLENSYKCEALGSRGKPEGRAFSLRAPTGWLREPFQRMCHENRANYPRNSHTGAGAIAREKQRLSQDRSQTAGWGDSDGPPSASVTWPPAFRRSPLRAGLKEGCWATVPMLRATGGHTCPAGGTGVLLGSPPVFPPLLLSWPSQAAPLPGLLPPPRILPVSTPGPLSCVLPASTPSAWPPKESSGRAVGKGKPPRFLKTRIPASQDGHKAGEEAAQLIKLEWGPALAGVRGGPWLSAAAAGGAAPPRRDGRAAWHLALGDQGRALRGENSGAAARPDATSG